MRRLSDRCESFVTLFIILSPVHFKKLTYHSFIRIRDHFMYLFPTLRLAAVNKYACIELRARALSMTFHSFPTVSLTTVRLSYKQILHGMGIWSQCGTRRKFSYTPPMTFPKRKLTNVPAWDVTRWTTNGSNYDLLKFKFFLTRKARCRKPMRI